jgi:hypothetical protein
MKRHVKIDKNRAISLKEMARISLDRLNSFDKVKYPSNTLDDYYDILHQLMESISILKGIKFSGDFAHKELIDWICEIFEFNNQDKLFLQSIRNYRNKISYEGFFIKPEFIKQNDKKILDIINKLKKIIKDLI